MANYGALDIQTVDYPYEETYCVQCGSPIRQGEVLYQWERHDDTSFCSRDCAFDWAITDMEIDAIITTASAI